MSNNYKRNYKKELFPKKIIANADILLGITHKDSFDALVEKQKSRLTGDKSNLLAKNKNKIIHSNSTSHLRGDNYNIININVNNLIITNSEKKLNNNIINNYNNINNNNIMNNSFNNLNHSRVFSKAGNVIVGKIKKKNNNYSMSKNNKLQKSKILNQLNINNNIKSFNIRNIPQKEKEKEKDKSLNPNPKYEKGPTSDIQDVIKDLLNNDNTNTIDKTTINSEDKNNKIFNSDEKLINLHVELWEELFNIELYADNKNGINNHVKKVLNLIENNFIQKNIIHNLFINVQLNKIYSKIIKIYFVLITYIKFLLVDFNYEMTIKSNIKRLLSSISNILLILIYSYTSNENILFSKKNKYFLESYSKLIKQKKIKKTKEVLSVFCLSTNKNLDISIYIIKQFSNNFFKVGYFTPIHNILLDIFFLIDTYTISDIAEIIIKGVLYYIIHNKNIENKNTSTIPNMVTIGGAGGIFSMKSLGFVQMATPFLPKLSFKLKNTTYTLILDLDETLSHFFYTPSGGCFLIRPYCFNFLQEMKKFFEIVIFTAATKDYADSILDIIDPEKKYINYRLYRSHTTICDFTFVKDLSKVGRNLNKTLIVDNLCDNFKLQPNNGIQIGTWIDDMRDTQLRDLGNILIKIMEKKPEDIRKNIMKLNEEINKNEKKNMNLNPFKDIDINKIID